MQSVLPLLLPLMMQFCCCSLLCSFVKFVKLAWCWLPYANVAVSDMGDGDGVVCAEQDEDSVELQLAELLCPPKPKQLLLSLMKLDDKCGNDVVVTVECR